MDNGGVRYLKTDWFELSLVTIPANAEATITQIKSIDRESRALRGRSVPAHIRVFEKQQTTKELPMTMTSEHLTRLETRRDEIERNIDSIIQKTFSESRTKNEDEQVEFDELRDQLQKINKDIEDLQSLAREKAVPATTRTLDDRQTRQPSPYGHITLKSNEAPGVAFARMVKCLFHAGMNHIAAADLAKQVYPSDRRIETVLRAAVVSASTGDADYMGDLAEAQTVQNEFIEFLRPMTILGRLGTNGLPAFSPSPFNVKIPRQSGDHASSWTGEGLPSPVSKAAFDTITMGKTSLSGLAVVTDEMLRFGNVNTDMIIRDSLAGSLIKTLDASLVDNVAEDTVRPAGLVNGLTAIAAAANGDVTAVRTDIQKLIEPILNANLSVTGIVIMMPERLALALSLMANELGVRAFPGMTAAGGQLEGFQVLASNHIAPGRVIALHVPTLYVAQDPGVDVAISREASIEMNDAPGQNGVAGTGASMVSLFQTNTAAFRVTHYVNWRLSRSTAVTTLSGVAWNGATSA
jgi:HK97 family phage major capsid protein